MSRTRYQKSRVKRYKGIDRPTRSLASGKASKNPSARMRHVSRQVQTLRQEGRWRDADQMLRRAIRHWPEDISFYNQRIAGFKNDQPRAYEVYEAIKRMGLRPDAYTFASLINACAAAEDLECAWETVAEMAVEGVRPDLMIYLSLINCCSQAGDPDRAEQTFAMMENDGFTPDCQICNCLLNAYANDGRSDRARKLFEKMNRCGPRPNDCTYAIMIKTYAKAKDASGAARAFREMRHAGHNPTIVTSNTLLDAFAKCGLVDEAMQFFEQMKAERFLPTDITYNTLLSAHAVAGTTRHVTALLAEMEADGIRPDRHTCDPLVELALKCRDDSLADRVLKMFQDMDIEMTRWRAKRLIETFRAACRPECVWDVVQAMKASGTPVDAGIQTRVISAFYRAGDFSIINRLPRTELTAAPRILIAECHRKLREYSTAIGICLGVESDTDVPTDQRDYAWIVRMYCLLHSDREAFGHEMRQCPFGKTSPHRIRYLCASVFGGLVPRDQRVPVISELSEAQMAPSNSGQSHDVQRALEHLSNTNSPVLPT
jgi:pentatricopeptide repeat protein